MQEALHSFNVKFRLQGFECQLTIRDDEQGTGKIVTAAQATVRILAGLVGVTPTNGNGHAPATQGPSASPRQGAQPAGFDVVCPHCSQADELELVSFERDGKPRKAWKCHRCNKWLPDKK